jgi:hypothetical protein
MWHPLHCRDAPTDPLLCSLLGESAGPLADRRLLRLPCRPAGGCVRCDGCMWLDCGCSPWCAQEAAAGLLLSVCSWGTGSGQLQARRVGRMGGCAPAHVYGAVGRPRAVPHSRPPLSCVWPASPACRLGCGRRGRESSIEQRLHVAPDVAVRSARLEQIQSEQYARATSPTTNVCNSVSGLRSCRRHAAYDWMLVRCMIVLHAVLCLPYSSRSTCQTCSRAPRWL